MKNLVGSHRWPYSSAHPDCWLKPWAGVQLSIDDPRAWAGTLAFPGKRPNRLAVKAHVAKCQAQGLLRGDEVPVLWDFGTYKQVWWQSVDGLRPYAEDLQEWEPSEPLPTPQMRPAEQPSPSRPRP